VVAITYIKCDVYRVTTEVMCIVYQMTRCNLILY